jgi:hypothetical protein
VGRTDGSPGRHQDATAILPDDPGSDFGEGRFASAIGAHEGDPLAPRNAQIDVVERLRRAETLAERTEQVSGQQMRASAAANSAALVLATLDVCAESRINYYRYT